MKTEDERKFVLQLKEEGKSISEIQDILHLTRNEVKNLWSYVPKVCKKKRGPKSKLNKFDTLKIRRKICQLEENEEK